MCAAVSHLSAAMMVTAFWLDSWWFNVLICFMSFVVRNLGSKCRWLRSAPMVAICFASSCAWWQRDGDVKTRVDAGAGSVEGGGRRQGARVVVSRGGGRTRDETAAGGSRGGLAWWWLDARRDGGGRRLAWWSRVVGSPEVAERRGDNDWPEFAKRNAGAAGARDRKKGVLFFSPN
ncbi:hypothetical protein DEO72_LG1g3175 [Vigna unguiculata]|uniref:Uncharacterized protein n=1 Tax=Vigna unguiculata TaxID=3917 RepID=A0A4D6KSK2_VIGUN|nr:hypothetical protein DEO72_LG1g3175 [Vigna unguiculata]